MVILYVPAVSPGVLESKPPRVIAVPSGKAVGLIV